MGIVPGMIVEMNVRMGVMVLVATTGTNGITITGILHGIIRGIVIVAVGIKRVKIIVKRFAARR